MTRVAHSMRRSVAAAILVVLAGGVGCKRRRERNPPPVFMMAGPEVRASQTQDPGGMPVGFDTPLIPGQAVQVKWGNRWYQSRVVAPLPDGTVRVHYLGWSDGSDESVQRSRIRIGGVIVPTEAPTAVNPQVGGETSRSSTQDPGGFPLAPGAMVLPGQPVQVRWNSSWYEARVIAPLPDGTVRVHYLGWSSSSDENVTRDRIRMGGQIR
jgi:hypothetical protein